MRSPINRVLLHPWTNGDETLANGRQTAKIKKQEFKPRFEREKKRSFRHRKTSDRHYPPPASSLFPITSSQKQRNDGEDGHRTTRHRRISLKSQGRRRTSMMMYAGSRSRDRFEWRFDISLLPRAPRYTKHMQTTTRRRQRLQTWKWSFQVSTSDVAILNPYLLSSSETGLDYGIRSWKKHLSDWDRCQKAIGGIYFTKK